MTSFVVWYRVSIATLIFLICQLLLLRLFIGCGSDSFLSFLEIGFLHFLQCFNIYIVFVYFS